MSESGAPPPGPVAVPPPNYLIWAILATLCCCPPVGVPAIAFGARVNGRWAAGDIEGARAESRRTRTWLLWTVAAGVLWWVVFVARVAWALLTDEAA